MSESRVIRWREVEPMGDLNGELMNDLTRVDRLRAAWEENVEQTPREEFEEARRRSLRRHAIETGIIERLYDVDWGVTQALVAEGLTAEVAHREDGISEDTLEVIRGQYEALEMLVDSCDAGQPLTLHFIKSLHHALTRHQATYEGHNALG